MTSLRQGRGLRKNLSFLKPARSPTLFPLVPCAPCGPQVTLGCFAADYFPSPAELSWDVGVASGGRGLAFPAVSRGRGLLGRSSVLTVGVAEAREGSFRCRAEHRGQNFTYDVTDVCPERPELSVSLLAEPKTPEIPQISLLCQARGKGAAEASLTWFLNDVIADFRPEVSACEETGSGRGQAELSSRVNVSRALWEGGANFRCRAEHPRLATPLEATITSFCAGPEPAPSVELLPPSLADLYLSPSLNLTCVASNLKSPEDAKFSWSRSTSGSGATSGATSGSAPCTSGSLESIEAEPEVLPNGKFRLRSFLRICAEDWNSGEAFTCQVTLAELGADAPIAKTVRKEFTSNAAAPLVAVFPPPPEELSLQESLTLTCLASAFFPRDIFLSWTIQDRPAPPEAYAVLGPAPDPGHPGKFFVYSKMAAAAESWGRGEVFACVVGHDGIGGAGLVQRATDKAQARPANVNVSVVLAGADSVCY